MTEEVVKNAVETPVKKKTGRPLGKKTDEKQKLLAQLKRIWGDLKANKATEVISAAGLYAELKGWKLKKPEVGEAGEVLSIQFEKDIVVAKEQPKKETYPTIVITPSRRQLGDDPELLKTEVTNNSKSEVAIIEESLTTTTTTTYIENKVEVEFK